MYVKPIYKRINNLLLKFYKENRQMKRDPMFINKIIVVEIAIFPNELVIL